MFKDLVLQGCVFIYLDDIIIPAKTDNEALQCLKLVFATASEHGLEINFKKCSSLNIQIEFLSHIIEHGKLYFSPSTIAAVIHFPEPCNLQSSFSLVRYFYKFILNFAYHCSTPF